MAESRRIEFRLLGEMQVSVDGEPVALPPSKKTRGLLAYLLLCGRAQRRDHLCELLWDDTEDPRGALRWSLSRLRGVVNADRARLIADRERVHLDLEGAWLDLLAVRTEAGDSLASLPTERLIALSDLFRGELLDGLNLAELHEFSAWCVAERESARKLHARILATLVDRLESRPDSALRHARKLKRIEPFDESVRARLVRLLAAAGRPMEAQEQYRAASRALHEAGVKPSGELLRARGHIRDVTANTRAESPGGKAEPPAPPSTAPAPLVGREREIEALSDLSERVMESRLAGGFLLSGEPGVGKTRLLDESTGRAVARGAVVLEACSYEAERRRVFGPWVDALRRLSRERLPEQAAAALAALLPHDRGGGSGEHGREHLFASVSDVVGALCADAPLLVLRFDDVQWLDEASTALLSYVARTSRQRPVLLALAGRSGELADNPAVQQMLQGLRRDHVLHEHPLRPLSAESTVALARAVAPAADPERVFADSAGNPLFAIELARALARGDGAHERHSYDAIVRDRVMRLPEDAMEVLRWASVSGTQVRLDVLERLPRFDTETLSRALDTLEQHGLLVELGDDESLSSGYRFVHELVRKVVFSDLSTPRRRLMHLQIARTLEQLQHTDPTGEAATVIADHAARGGDPAMAARACVQAARRCMRVFAHREADALARRGMRYADTLEEPDRTTLTLELSHVRLHVRRPDDPAATAAAVELLTERALDHGCLEHARMGFYLLSLLRWESGDWTDARRFSVRVEELGRSGSEMERALSLGTTGQCLVLLERDLPQAEAMLMEAEALGERAGDVPAVVLEAQGILRRHTGELDEAAALLRRARDTARRDGEHLGEFNALEQTVCLELERGHLGEAARVSGELVKLAERVRAGSEAPYARALHALVGYAAGEVGRLADLDAALASLRDADAKHRLAYVLNRTAGVDLERGEPARAAARAAEALAAASALERGSEVVIAHCVAARAALALGDPAGAARHRDAATDCRIDGISLEAWTRLADLDDALDTRATA